MTALVAAYAIALAGLIASFGAASATAGTGGAPGLILCHTVVDGASAPAPADSGKLCDDCCCGLGCAMAMAALPPPPVAAVPMPQARSHRLVPPAVVARPDGATATSHRSRAPPLKA